MSADALGSKGATLNAPSESSGEADVRGLLARVYGAPTAHAQNAFVAQGMIVSELVELYELVRREQARRVLEVGMANGTSAVVICEAMRAHGGGHLTSIDPFQSAVGQFAGGGVRAVAAAGFEAQHRLMEEPSFLALPTLLAAGTPFDLVFIDGWHSFDYTLVDLFYADLLLRDGGVVALHDTTAPPVYKAVRFLETHKPYERISPAVMVELPTLAARGWRRLRTAVAGSEARADARARRDRWRMLAAYRKMASVQVPERMAGDF